MGPKYEEMAQQMRADGVSEETIVRFAAEEMAEDEFRRGKGVTEIEALREWKKTPSISASCCSPTRSAITAARRSSCPATRCACATTACSSRAVEQNAALKSQGSAIDAERYSATPII